jgi:hypothetical protein
MNAGRVLYIVRPTRPTRPSDGSQLLLKSPEVGRGTSTTSDLGLPCSHVPGAKVEYRGVTIESPVRTSGNFEPSVFWRANQADSCNGPNADGEEGPDVVDDEFGASDNLDRRLDCRVLCALGPTHC